VCTYQTENVQLHGSSAKGATGWFSVTRASVYFDHPVHAPAEHTLNIDLLNETLGPDARVAVELDPGTAEALAQAILRSVALARTLTVN
jgi:hypothetical protein